MDAKNLTTQRTLKKSQKTDESLPYRFSEVPLKHLNGFLFPHAENHVKEMVFFSFEIFLIHSDPVEDTEETAGNVKDLVPTCDKFTF